MSSFNPHSEWAHISTWLDLWVGWSLGRDTLVFHCWGSNPPSLALKANTSSTTYIPRIGTQDRQGSSGPCQSPLPRLERWLQRNPRRSWRAFPTRTRPRTQSDQTKQHWGHLHNYQEFRGRPLSRSKSGQWTLALCGLGPLVWLQMKKELV